MNMALIYYSTVKMDKWYLSIMMQIVPKLKSDASNIFSYNYI